MSPSLLLGLVLVAPQVAETPGHLAPDDPRILVFYDFDGEEVETGPWTLTAFEGARGSVVVTPRQRRSGWRSVEIRDVAGDGDFAELQGFFRELATGTLHVHFALMLADPGEPANVALAGPAHFRMVRDGLAVWLEVRGGRLLDVSAGGNRDLVPIEPLAWYAVDLAYHVERGAYDLVVRSEAGEVLVAERDVPNAVGLPGSRVHKFSFIGDTPGRDRSDAILWVDDLLIVADRPVPRPGPFVAPGRRMLFVESAGVPPGRWLELRGDALFEAGETVAARASYEAALAAIDDPAPIWAKLSDVHFVLGDLEGERTYRERVHGSLRQ